MKSVLIDPVARFTEIVDVSGAEDIATLIGFDTISSDEIGKQGNHLYFDEDCFLRGSSGRFQLDSLAPVAGKALIVGTSVGGNVLRDVVTEVDSLRSRIKYLRTDAEFLNSQLIIHEHRYERHAANQSAPGKKGRPACH